MKCPKCGNTKKFQWMGGIVYCLECKTNGTQTNGSPAYFGLDTKKAEEEQFEAEYKHQFEQEQLKLKYEAEEEARINAESEQDSLDQLDQSDQEEPEEYDGEEYGN